MGYKREPLEAVLRSHVNEKLNTSKDENNTSVLYRSLNHSMIMKIVEGIVSDNPDLIGESEASTAETLKTVFCEVKELLKNVDNQKLLEYADLENGRFQVSTYTDCGLLLTMKLEKADKE